MVNHRLFLALSGFLVLSAVRCMGDGNDFVPVPEDPPQGTLPDDDSVQDDDTTAVDDDAVDDDVTADDDSTESYYVPDGFVEIIPPLGGFNWGEFDPDLLEIYDAEGFFPNTHIPGHTGNIESPYLISQYQWPIFEGLPQPIDGLQLGMMEAFEASLPSGFYICSLSQIGLAMAGLENSRFPTGEIPPGMGVCDDYDLDSDQLLGTFPDCESSYGVKYLGRSAWGKMDKSLLTALDPSYQAYPYAVTLGVTRGDWGWPYCYDWMTDGVWNPGDPLLDPGDPLCFVPSTFYNAGTASVHAHGDTAMCGEPGGGVVGPVDDQVFICADQTAVSAQSAGQLQTQVDRFVNDCDGSWCCYINGTKPMSSAE
ncbi:hypothetical protein EPN81_05025 [Patescibacteria group bacterium]|nr:MAG: hypothetical protein EPN81_05025 [Patescibacteria group bacterium]